MAKGEKKMKMVASDCVVSFVSTDGSLRHAVVWIDVDDPDAHPWWYVRTATGFLSVFRLPGVIRDVDSERPAFEKLSQLAPPPPPQTPQVSEPQAAQAAQAAEPEAPRRPKTW